jgi:hypothetical protein
MSRELISFDGSEFIQSSAPPPMTWALEGVVPRTGLTFVIGSPKSAKSVLTLTMALAISGGLRQLWNREVGLSGTVLIVQQEGSRESLHRRMTQLAGFYGIPLSFGAVRIVHREALKLDDLNDQLALSELIAEIEPVLVLLDPLARLTRIRDENDAAGWGRVLDYLNDLAAERAVVVVHHSRKTLGGRIRATDARGSSALHAAVDATVCIWSEGDESRKVEVESRDGDGLTRFALKFAERGSVATLAIPWAEATSPDGVIPNGVLLDELETAPGSTVPQLVALLDGVLSDDSIRRRLKNLEALGLVRSEGGGGKGSTARWWRGTARGSDAEPEPNRNPMPPARGAVL